MYSFPSNDSVNRVDPLGLCELGARRNCRSSAPEFRSPTTDDALEMLDRGARVVNAASTVATVGSVATGDVYGAATGSAPSEFLKTSRGVMRDYGKGLDEVMKRPINGYVEVDFEECVCSFLVFKKWRKKTKTVGPFQVEYRNNGYHPHGSKSAWGPREPFPGDKPATQEEIEQMKSLAEETVCKGTAP